jgi:predicted nucleic acid-binding protein
MSKLGNPAKIYRMFLDGNISLVYSEGIILEYKDVLYRPYLKIITDDADKVIETIQHYGEFVKTIESIIPMIDEDDRIFYDTAQRSDAVLITGNIKHYPAENHIMTPRGFLEMLNIEKITP